MVTLTLTTEDAMALRLALVSTVIDSMAHARDNSVDPETASYFREEAHTASRLRGLVCDAMRVAQTAEV